MSGSASYVSLDELVDAIGESAAVQLLAAHGGTRIYVPAHPGPDHALVAAIGAEPAARLADHVATGVGGLWIELPRGSSSWTAELRTRLLDAVGRPGRSEREIAQDLRVHGRTVRRARARLRQQHDSKQGRLF